MSTIIDLGKLRFLFRGIYSAATNYELNDVVTYGGNAYVYINRIAGAGTVPSTTSHWSSMVDGLSDQVDYDNTTTYHKNDLVKVSGRVYRALQTTVGNIPPNATYWVADECSKSLTGCRMRWGANRKEGQGATSGPCEISKGQLPYGGFPAAKKISRLA